MALGSPVVPLENINQAMASMSTSNLSGHSNSLIGYQLPTIHLTAKEVKLDR